MLAPAARESMGVRAVRTGGVPPLKCASRLEPLVSEAVTTDAVPSIAVTVMVALPSPVAMTGQEFFPQPRAAFPLETV